jgi:chemotaxis protein methyltransferase CheR
MQPSTSTSLPPPAFCAPLSRQSYGCFSEFITRELGIRMPPEKLPMLQSRLQRRLRQVGLKTLEEYQHYLFQLPRGADEWTEFINLATTNKTDFFREPLHFDLLVQNTVPGLARATVSPWVLKLWCAGCSTGEEPYTLAMVLAEYQRNHPGFDFTILATDISTRVLDHAQNAIYDEDRIAPVPVDFRRRYFLRSKDRSRPRVRVIPELRDRVRFGRLNFMSEDFGITERFDVVFFRNVMIYFDKNTQLAVLRKICDRLKRGGGLFVGHSESLVGFDLPVRSIAASAFVKTA